MQSKDTAGADAPRGPSSRSTTRSAHPAGAHPYLLSGGSGWRDRAGEGVVVLLALAIGGGFVWIAIMSVIGLWRYAISPAPIGLGWTPTFLVVLGIAAALYLFLNFALLRDQP